MGLKFGHLGKVGPGWALILIIHKKTLTNDRLT